jgi:hypothetical protein
MKIEQIKAAYSQMNHQVKKPEGNTEFNNVLHVKIKNEVFTQDEKRYFENLYPGIDTDSYIEKKYSSDGNTYRFRVGHIIDKKG